MISQGLPNASARLPPHGQQQLSAGEQCPHVASLAVLLHVQPHLEVACHKEDSKGYPHDAKQGLASLPIILFHCVVAHLQQGHTVP